MKRSEVRSTWPFGSRSSWLAAACLCLAASASGAEEEAQADPLSFPPEIEALLNESSSAEDYTERERCINTRSIRNTRVLDDQHIVFELTSNRYYLVQFKHRCFRLRPRSTVIYETRSSQLCRLDAIRAADSSLASSADIGPPCTIPGFIPVEPEQVALLKESLKAQRQAAQP